MPAKVTHLTDHGSRGFGKATLGGGAELTPPALPPTTRGSGIAPHDDAAAPRGASRGPAWVASGDGNWLAADSRFRTSAGRAPPWAAAPPNAVCAAGGRGGFGVGGPLD